MPLVVPAGQSCRFFLSRKLAGPLLAALDPNQKLMVESADPLDYTITMDDKVVTPAPPGVDAVLSGVLAAAAKPDEPEIALDLSIPSVGATAGLGDTVTVSLADGAVSGTLFESPTLPVEAAADGGGATPTPAPATPPVN